MTLGAVGLAVGTVFGLFGAGGSAFATPVLALLGVPGALAVATPLPAMLPGSVVAVRSSARTGAFDRRLARLTVLGGLPGTIVGALGSRLVSGRALLILSGVMLVVVGARVLIPEPADAFERAASRRRNDALVAGAAFGVGVLTGLLANGGGFLLVPLFMVGFGLAPRIAAGTSMLAVGLLTIPTLAVHVALGHVDWPIALVFGAGMIPGVIAGSRVADRISGPAQRVGFGVMLVLFGVWFALRQFTA